MLNEKHEPRSLLVTITNFPVLWNMFRCHKNRAHITTLIHGVPIPAGAFLRCGSGSQTLF